MWQRYINTNIDFLDIIHLPDFLRKNDVSETKFFLHSKTKAYSIGLNR
jgi:hypothetical protein